MNIKAFVSRLLRNTALKRKLYVIIFESDTPMGKTFDVALIVAILISVMMVIFETFFSHPALITTFHVMEGVLTFFFTMEYLLRIYCSPNARAYVLSFFGLIDLLSILPVYFTFLFPGAHYILVMRSFRLIRVFRVFKLFNFLNQGNLLLRSIHQSLPKIGVFFLFVLILNLCVGTVMFALESGHPESGFNDIPSSIYWSIVTMTTVGYGDITPVTEMGKFMASMVMLLGYTIIAVPTGIVSAQMVNDARAHERMTCPNCGRSGHDMDATHCKYCGAELEL